MLLKCGDGDMMQVMTTLGVDYSAKNLAGPGQTTIRLNLWDVAGFLKNWQNQITKMVNGDGIGHDLIKPRTRTVQSSLSGLPARLPG